MWVSELECNLKFKVTSDDALDVEQGYTQLTGLSNAVQ
jgi:hypothetical protein